MSQLTTNVKNFVIEFKSPDRNESPRQRIFVTEQIAMEVLRMKKDPKIRDIDFFDEDGSFKEFIDKNEIRTVKRVGGQEERSDGGMMFRCDYGGIHPYNTSGTCACREKFGGVYAFEFFITLNRLLNRYYPEVLEKLPYPSKKICYPHQVTDSMRELVSNYIKSKSA